jgi:hypothetical protein
MNGTLIPVTPESPLFVVGDKVSCTQKIGKTTYGPYEFTVDKVDGPDTGGTIRVSGFAQDGKRHTIPQKFCKKEAGAAAPAAQRGPRVRSRSSG